MFLVIENKECWIQANYRRCNKEERSWNPARTIQIVQTRDTRIQQITEKKRIFVWSRWNWRLSTNVDVTLKPASSGSCPIDVYNIRKCLGAGVLNSKSPIKYYRLSISYGHAKHRSTSGNLCYAGQPFGKAVPGQFTKRETCLIRAERGREI